MNPSRKSPKSIALALGTATTFKVVSMRTLWDEVGAYLNSLTPLGVLGH